MAEELDEQTEGSINESNAPGELTKDDKMWGMLCHMSILLVNFIGPLIIWLMKKEESSFVDFNGKEALNFQISMTIYFVIAFALCIVLIGFLLVPLIGITNIIFVIIAGIKANEGEKYVYPMTIRFIK